MIKKIVKYPNAGLRTRCAEVTFPLHFLVQDHITDLKDTLAVSQTGVALASNQIPDGSHRIFVVKPGNKLPEIVINPTLSLAREIVKSDYEGCLSVPESNAKIERAVRCVITYQDTNGLTHTEVLSGIDAIIAQHECDHLDGKLITDKLSFSEQIRIKAEAIRNRKAGR